MTAAVQETIHVALGDRSYRIVVQDHLLKDLGRYVLEATTAEKVGVVTDRHVAARYLAPALRALRAAGFKPVPMVLPPGERTKTLASVERILDVCAKERFERSSILLALGGGVIGDLAGFAAAIYQRGIPFIQVPTTLVAQVDSSVGGKTGVDHRLGKNLIGAFYQPRAVLIDPHTLETLPVREWMAGLAEVIKYGVIADEPFFAYLERHMPSLLKLDKTSVRHIIKRSCEIKARVVAEDERESDRRRILNYGHTIGHALEALAGYRGVIHGEAVGIGLVQEAELACHLGLCGGEVVERIRGLVVRAGLSDELPRVPFNRLWHAMQHDKKVAGGKVVGVWPARIGEVVMRPLERDACAGWFHARHAARLRPSGRRRRPSHRVVASRA